MRPQNLAAAAFFVTSALATNTWNRINTSPVDNLRSLKARQGGDSFMPDKTSGSGNTCAEAFGDGYVQCGTGKTCFNPTIGQSCCSEYSCPSGSGCLTDGYCCPDSLGPKACLEKFSLSLLPMTTPSATPIPPATITQSYPTISPSTSLCTGSNHTVIPTGGIPSATAPVFDGGANSQNVATGAVAILGFLSFIQNLL
ncbi:hypothetical protein EMCG_01895 [[Emmonsia] crescens]|uniref:Prp 4 CRoW domain-containing protein n=1 Tax=[Emmonsia] crescens TaxID=73230 RepID=A0A0G2J9D5_9EURO|nr:hypothetical protein EMCG_01895 [Emmonsia crescens UAMH 3008]